MNTLIGILTAAAIAMHSILGCCAHMAHGGHHSSCEHGGHCGGAEHSHHDDACHAEVDDALAAPLDGTNVTWSSHEESHRCNHSRCAWHAPEIWGAGWVGAFADAIAQPTLSDLDDAAVATYSVLAHDFDSSPSAALPVRSHLMKSVLLI